MRDLPKMDAKSEENILKAIETFKRAAGRFLLNTDAETAEELTAYLRAVGERVLKKMAPTDLHYRFFLVDLPVANAFAIPGARIYVSRKLVAFTRSEDELAGILAREGAFFLRNDFGFRTLAWKELRKYSRRHLVGLAGELVAGVTPEHYRRWGKAGIRAQLLDIRKKKLEMDFVFQHDDRSMHVLNAVSPGFTCSLPFAHYLCEHIR